MRKFTARRLLMILMIVLAIVPSPHVAADDGIDQAPLQKAVADVIVAAPQSIEAPVVTVTPPPPVLPASPLLITSYRTDHGLPTYVQIFNTSSTTQDLNAWSIKFSIHTANGDITSPALHLSGYLPGKKYAVIARQGMAVDADLEFNLSDDGAFLGLGSLQLIAEGFAPDTRAMPFITGVRYDLSQSSAGNYVSTSKYIATEMSQLLLGKGLYTFTDATPLRVVEFLANAADCAPLVHDGNCLEFVKLQNQSTEPIDLAGYRLRLGYGNDSPSIDTSIPLGGTLLPGKFTMVNTRSDGKALSIVASDGNIWLEDILGLHAYGETVVSYQNLGDVTHKGLSWALDATDATWKWATASPDAENSFLLPDKTTTTSASTANDLKPCADNQYRSLETNRCRLLSVATSSLTACKDGQYRSEETNRCRSIAVAAAAILKPCADDQFRNPTSGRCKQIASTDDLPSPCPAGKERNPATNRCRNIQNTTLPTTAFAPEPIKQGVKSFIGWWALGGIGIAGAGYAVWEWRRELTGVIKKAITFTTTGK